MTTPEQTDADLFNFTPARQHRYLNPEDLRRGSGNFYGHFVDLPGVFNSARQRPAWKRFEARKPDLARALTQIVSREVKTWGDLFAKDQATYTLAERLPWDRLYEAYQIIAQLVGQEDPNVMQSGEVDQGYLWR